MRISDWSSECALPICNRSFATKSIVCPREGGDPSPDRAKSHRQEMDPRLRWGTQRFSSNSLIEIGRASCRERVCQYVEISVVDVSLKKKTKTYNDQQQSKQTRERRQQQKSKSD